MSDFEVAKRVCAALGLSPWVDAYRGQILDGWVGVSWVSYIERLVRSVRRKAESAS